MVIYDKKNGGRRLDFFLEKNDGLYPSIFINTNEMNQNLKLYIYHGVPEVS